MGCAATPLRVVLLGPPASGKGTHGRRLATSLGLAYLSTGAVLREHVEALTDLGKLAKPILDRGGYLPDDLMCPLLEDWLPRQSGGWVLDGFPRSLPQAVFLDKWLARRGLKIDAAISLDVPLSELVQRIEDRVECPECRWSGQQWQLAPGGKCVTCGAPASRRADDGEKNFLSRHADFVRFAQPVSGHYQKAGVLSSCDATGPQDEVAALLMKFIATRFG